MTTNQDRVREFMLLTGCPMADRPTLADDATNSLRLALIDEEFNEELKDAVAAGDLVGIADALADILYVVYGYALTLGIDIDAVVKEVHRTNMLKAPGGVIKYREDGKIMKPEGWVAPDIQGVLHRGVEARDRLRALEALWDREALAEQAVKTAQTACWDALLAWRAGGQVPPYADALAAATDHMNRCETDLEEVRQAIKRALETR